MEIIGRYNISRKRIMGSCPEGVLRLVPEPFDELRVNSASGYLRCVSASSTTRAGTAKPSSQPVPACTLSQAQVGRTQIGRASLQRAPFVQLDWIAQSTASPKGERVGACHPQRQAVRPAKRSGDGVHRE